VDHADKLSAALFEAGAGVIGNYSECSFSVSGTGSFKAGAGTNPFVGQQGEQHREKEIKLEMVFPPWLESKILSALKSAHPYEEVAYDIVSLSNPHPGFGSGLVGELPAPMDEKQFIRELGQKFGLQVIRHTAWQNKPVRKIALCGGAGSFLISKALAQGADVYITGDIKYHEFFEANSGMLIADIGHFESEQFTINLLQEVLAQKFPTFAVLKTEVKTNPVQYFISGN